MFPNPYVVLPLLLASVMTGGCAVQESSPAPTADAETQSDSHRDYCYLDMFVEKFGQEVRGNITRKALPSLMASYAHNFQGPNQTVSSKKSPFGFE